jgi:hypothetical protein
MSGAMAKVGVYLGLLEDNDGTTTRPTCMTTTPNRDVSFPAARSEGGRQSPVGRATPTTLVGPGPAELSRITPAPADLQRGAHDR